MNLDWLSLWLWLGLVLTMAISWCAWDEWRTWL